MHGGGHERGFRSGILATHQIVGMGEAFAIAKQDMQKDYDHALALRERLLEKVFKIWSSNRKRRLRPTCTPNLNVSFAFVEGESLLMSLKT